MVIFLDIDGVLCTPRFNDYQVKHFESDYWNCQFNFDPICMKNLKTLYDACDDCEIVISSSWRNTNNGMNDINKNLKLYQIPITNKKTELLKDRKLEIENYIKTHNIKKYIILDDENIELDNIVLCDEYYGFTKKHLQDALKLI